MLKSTFYTLVYEKFWQKQDKSQRFMEFLEFVFYRFT